MQVTRIDLRPKFKRHQHLSDANSFVRLSYVTEVLIPAIKNKQEQRRLKNYIKDLQHLHPEGEYIRFWMIQPWVPTIR